MMTSVLAGMFVLFIIALGSPGPMKIESIGLKVISESGVTIVISPSRTK
jgi:hypothetical protein